MDFLKSAVASAISKGPSFPYSFGDRVDVGGSIWTLFNGTKREDGSNCSIFSFDVVANKSRLPLARNAVKKLRTLRHPGVVKVLDTVETDTYIYVATERLTPLGWNVRRKSLSTEVIKWGLCGVAKTLKFINDEASSVHGNVRVSSIFTGESGEWKLGGFELLSSMKDDEAVIYNYAGLVPESNRYAPPEVGKSGWDTIKRHPITAVDAYSFGTLIYEVFNGAFTNSEQIALAKNIPPSMQQSYKRLTNTNPKARLSISHFLEQGSRNGSFFDTPLIHATQGIESLGMKDEQEREEFLSELDELSDDFPEEFFKLKVLPELLKSLEFGGGGPKVFSVVMKIAMKLSDDEYDARITPVIVRLFASPDRAMRVCLLDNLPLMIERLPQKVVNDQIFPQMVTGFLDVAPMVREQTVKAILTIIVKLSDRTINGELLKYLAKTSNDDQPGIRTNTTICLGKIAKNLGSSTRQKVLAAAFTRSLKDPFVHARNAALMALAATSDVFTDEDCANRILPAVCPSLIDREKLVRDQANKTLEIYLQRIRKYGLTLPETAIPPSGGSEASVLSVPRMGTPQSDTSWAGWAISSFTNKLAAASGDIQPTPNSASSRVKDNRSTALPSASDVTRATSSAKPASTLHRQPIASPQPTSTHNSQEDHTTNKDDFAAWGDMEEDSFFDASTEIHPASSSTTTNIGSAKANFDDGGEPDFAGWLSAQAQAKPKTHLPKGLVRPSTASSIRPGAGIRSTAAGSISNAASAKQTIVNPKSNPKTARKTVDTKPKDQGWTDDDGWGDGWE
ncbi:hypothetical protein FGG08_001195 [Glutinoglossum americanum]|uniref:Protein kinase domain-containing protein n=1 Tax=Glutinoglossum americanum TaxID=1670608 RepID=A0A9P8IBK4_9PEZI|nr:hypothetical protein FGG08_001195 [Glutinoglossum americanum]